MTIIRKFGQNLDIDIASAPEDIWRGGGPYPFPIAADVLHVVSDNNADRFNEGSAARTLRISGLDADFIPISEIVNLGGTTAVLTTQSFLRITRARVLTVGTNDTNLGDITVRLGNAAGDILTVVGANLGSSSLGIYTTPADMRVSKIVLWRASVSFTANGRARMALEIRPENGAWVTEDLVELRQPGNAQFEHNYTQGITLDEKQDVRIRALSTDVDNVEVSSEIEISIEHGAAGVFPIVNDL